MKKRIVCVLLAMILLAGLVPATAITAFAASNKTSEAAITVLKQLEGYSTICNTRGYIGYGTLCTEKGAHGAHKINEKKADAALREALADLDKAVNSYASKNGLALSQNQHDALVLFSFQNGTAWTAGTGDFQRAIKTRATGNEFLNMICNWSQSDNNDRRMIEANMYLNNRYSSVVPSRYIQVSFDANGGSLDTSKNTFYYDVSLAETHLPTPTRSGFIFRGWYDGNDWISRLTVDCADLTLKAYWQGKEDKVENAISVSYKLNSSQLASTKVYDKPNGNLTNAVVKGDMWFDQEFIDSKGVKWARFWYVDLYTYTNPKTKKEYKVEKYDNHADAANCPTFWVKVGTFQGSSSAGSGRVVDVTVTNSYLNSRQEPSIYSAKNGSYNYGAKLHIMGEPVSAKDGILWGNVVDNNGKSLGYVALLYTDWNSVQGSTGATSLNGVIATALITVNGYVQVRSGAGIENRIVGSLPKNTQVDIYETKYVNGQQWGRCNTGWFCLSYAEVTRKVEDTTIVSDVGFTSYAFTGTLHDSAWVHVAPSDTAAQVAIEDKDRKNVTFTNITAGSNGTWAKMSKGWVRITDTEYNTINVTLDVARFYVSADSATVRTSPNSGASRVDTLVKGVEFNVTRIVADNTTVWGYANKVGEDNKTYNGWINLASKYVSRNGAPVINVSTNKTGKTATVINVDKVNVRASASVYGKWIGSLSRGATAPVLEGPTEDGWYRLDIDVDNNKETDSWVFGQYLSVTDSVSSGNAGNSGSTTVKTGSGIIANTYGGVNLRRTPGTNGALIGKILPGTPVTILEVKTVGSSDWGRVEKGWICMDYVAMMSYEDIPGNSGSGNAGSNGSSSTSEVAIYTGTVKNTLSTVVNVRKTTSLDSDVVRTLNPGDPITLHEIVTVTENVTETVVDENKGSTTTVVTVTSYWARVNDGYIYNPGSHLDLDALDENIYTVTGAEKLNVRNTAGATDEGSVAFQMKKGVQVAVTRLQIVNGNVWGYVECDDGEGWASLAYMTKGAVSVQNGSTNNNTNNNNSGSAEKPTEPTAPSAPVNGSLGNTGASTGGAVKYTGKIINTKEVNVRATASLSAKRSTTLKQGTSVSIYETTIADGMAWGRCDAGWIYLFYVDMTPASGSAVDARVVYRDNTTIYTDSNRSAVAGTYAKMAVIDIYEVVGKMARTELGWVDTDNLL